MNVVAMATTDRAGVSSGGCIKQCVQQGSSPLRTMEDRTNETSEDSE